MILNIVFDSVTVVVSYLQFVVYIDLNIIAVFVLVAKSFNHPGINILVTKIILHDGDWTWIIIRGESFIGILAIRTLPVHASFKLHR